MIGASRVCVDGFECNFVAVVAEVSNDADITVSKLQIQHSAATHPFRIPNFELGYTPAGVVSRNSRSITP
jgi:hypothetical protein